jgi:hypothetical protein
MISLLLISVFFVCLNAKLPNIPTDLKEGENVPTTFVFSPTGWDSHVQQGGTELTAEKYDGDEKFEEVNIERLQKES